MIQQATKIGYPNLVGNFSSLHTFVSFLPWLLPYLLLVRAYICVCVAAGPPRHHTIMGCAVCPHTWLLLRTDPFRKCSEMHGYCGETARLSSCVNRSNQVEWQSKGRFLIFRFSFGFFMKESEELQQTVLGVSYCLLINIDSIKSDIVEL